jgi:hypothetical protein
MVCCTDGSIIRSYIRIPQLLHNKWNNTSVLVQDLHMHICLDFSHGKHFLLILFQDSHLLRFGESHK